MATTTTNYGFDVPTSSDLVKNGATQIALLGQDLDTFLFRPFTVNAIINGGFDIWQRGTTTTSSGYQTADRWSCGNLGGGTTTFSRESSIVPTGSTYSMKFAQATANGLPVADQVIESLNALQFAGKTVAISLQAAASASTTATIELSFSTATDNPVSGSFTNITATSGGSGTVTTTASFAAINGIYAVPSTAKTLRLRIYTNPLTTGTSFYFGQVQLEVGNQSSPFTRAGGSIQGELAACQRYFTKSYNTDVAPATVTATGALTTYIEGTGVANVSMQAQFKSSMRIAPTITTYSGQGTTSQFSTDVTGSDSVASTVVANIGTYGFYVSNTTTATKFMLVHYAANAEL
jgi:hypothetical protein